MNEKIVYRRSNRAEKAIQNGIFMAVAGFVFGTAFGVLVGIKYNIGGKDKKSLTVEKEASAEVTESAINQSETSLFSGVQSTNSAMLVEDSKYFLGMVEVENPLRGTWVPKYSQVSVALRFTENFDCEILQPDISAGLSSKNWKQLDLIPYTARIEISDPNWKSVSNDVSVWSDVSAVTAYEFTNRDGSIVSGEKDHSFRIRAKFEGVDSPQDSDDYIVFELELIGNFFEVSDNSILTSLPASRTWERRIEANFREDPNPLL